VAAAVVRHWLLHRRLHRHDWLLVPRSDLADLGGHHGELLRVGPDDAARPVAGVLDGGTEIAAVPVPGLFPRRGVRGKSARLRACARAADADRMGGDAARPVPLAVCPRPASLQRLRSIRPMAFGRYFRLFAALGRFSLATEMAYRANFLVRILVEVLW